MNPQPSPNLPPALPPKLSWGLVLLVLGSMALFFWLWSLTKADPEAKQEPPAYQLEPAPNPGIDPALLQGQMPEFGFLKCHHPYGDQMEDDLYCPVSRKPLQGHLQEVFAVTSLTQALAAGWKVKQILPAPEPWQGDGQPRLQIYLEKLQP